MNVADALKQLESEGKPFTVVQLGAYIGNTPNDPLWPHFKYEKTLGCGHLFAIEPIQAYFNQLRINYDGVPWVYCYRLAIADHDGYASMYRLGVQAEDHGYHDWHNQLSSLKPERLTEMWDRCEATMHRETRPDHQFLLENRIEELVPCRTFKTFCREQGIERIDLLVMDVEGSEFDILASMDWEIPIRYLSFEFNLLTPEQIGILETMLRMRGYELEQHGGDVFCYPAS